MREVLLQWTIQNERGPAIVDKRLFAYANSLFNEGELMNLGNPVLYYVKKEYLKHMHKEDYRVSVKYNNRVFVGIVMVIEEQKYVIPLTSQTTEERKKVGKKKRSPLITTYITESSGEEIANLLYNNMIPVCDDVISPISIDSKVDTYLLNEIRFIRKSWDKIQRKALNVYNDRYNITSHNYSFLIKTCCDFKKLEISSNNYQTGK